MHMTAAILSPDASLVERAREGDERAFTELYRKHVRHVARTVHSLLRQNDEVDDVVQRAFAEACLRLDALRATDGFGPWVTRIAVRDALDLLRARRRRKWLADAFSLVAPRSQPASDGRLVSRLYEALEHLPVRLRAPWTLHTLDGHTFEEVAAMCDIGLNTAKRRVAAAQSLIDRRLA